MVRTRWTGTAAASAARVFWLAASLPALPALLACGRESPAPAQDGAATAQIRRLIASRDFESAERASRSLVEAAERESGPESPRTAAARDLLVETLWKGDHSAEDDTLRVAAEALALRARATPADARGLSTSLLNLAMVHSKREEFNEAKPLCARSLALLQQGVGPDDLEVARVVNNCAILEWSTGDYGAARPLFERALAIRQKKLDPDHDDVAASLNNLGLLYRDTGAYSRSRPLLERALKIREGKPYAPPALLQQTLDNLAGLYARMGDLKMASDLFARALAIAKQSLPPDDPDLATSFNDLGNVLLDMGRLDEARERYQNALDIRLKARAPNELDVARSLYSLAEVELEGGRPAQARPLLQRAVQTTQAAGRANHPDLIYELLDLAYLDWADGHPDQARGSYDRALAIAESALGPADPQVAICLNNLAYFLAKTGRPREALARALRAEEIGRDHLRLTVRSLAEREALGYASVRVSSVDLILSLASGDLAPDQRSRVFDAVIRSRALILDEMSYRHRRTSESDPETSRLRGERDRALKDLAQITVLGPQDDPPETYRDDLETARKVAETAERALAARSHGRGDDDPAAHAGLTDIAAAIPSGTTLVSFARYRRWDLSPGPPAPAGSGRAQPPARSADAVPARGRNAALSGLAESDSYLAFALTAGRRAPSIVPVGTGAVRTAADVDALVTRWREEASPLGARRHASPAEALAVYRAAGDALRSAVWDPLLPAIARASRVFVVADGSLSLVNFAALPDARGGYLIDSARMIHQLSAERDLLSARPGAPKGRGLLAVGGPDFDSGLSAGGGAGNGSSAGSGGESESVRAGHSGCLEFKDVRFDSLPSSLKEAKEIGSAWDEHKEGPAELLGGADATEAAVKRSAPGHRVIHLSTHGFFLQGRCASLSEGTRGVGGLRPSGEDAALPDGEDPLVLSGLALAGANHRDQASLREEDGILTAEEVTSLDLKGVQWVVLSACDTGVGRVEIGEGVLGLRRAFEIAGARTVIMSLWPVGDESTEQWMRELYRARSDGLPTAEAVRRAGRSVLGALRRSGASTHPSSWGAFVAAGDWR